MQTTRPLLALFATGEAATTALARLRADGFVDTWAATTKPAPARSSDVPPATPLDAPPNNEVAESSDGVLGTIGRFLSGRGDSLRRSLEDHGIDPLVAIDIDTHLPTNGAIVIVFPDDREDLAAATLRAHGADLRDAGDLRSANLAVRDAAPLATAAAEPSVFYERRR
jgi:hypothetical protein